MFFFYEIIRIATPLSLVLLVDTPLLDGNWEKEEEAKRGGNLRWMGSQIGRRSLGKVDR